MAKSNTHSWALPVRSWFPCIAAWGDFIAQKNGFLVGVVGREAGCDIQQNVQLAKVICVKLEILLHCRAKIIENILYHPGGEMTVCIVKVVSVLCLAPL